jgi:nucleotide-binding universal stress UspA family protein
MTTSVIVGVDGSPSATAAAEIAGDLAVRHRLPLRVLHVFSWPALYPPFLPASVAVQTHPRAVSRHLVETVAAAVAQTHPDLVIDTKIVDGYPPAVLVDASRHAAFVVVGHRGIGGFAELLTGSVGGHITTHAHCPVLVVRGRVPTDAPRAPIVVGVDGSKASRAAIQVALAEARTRGCDVVMAQVLPPAHSWPDPTTDTDRTDAVRAVLDDVAGGYPDVKVRAELLHGRSPAHVLATLADDVGAGLIVVGTRGIGGFRGLLMGGTCRALIDHTPCPLIVVPPDTHPIRTEIR